MGFPRQEYWSGLPFPSPGDLPEPGIEPVSPVLAGGFFTTELPGKPFLVLWSRLKLSWVFCKIDISFSVLCFLKCIFSVPLHHLYLNLLFPLSLLLCILQLRFHSLQFLFSETLSWKGSFDLLLLLVFQGSDCIIRPYLYHSGVCLQCVSGIVLTPSQSLLLFPA